jgi:hypothetical protein
MIIKFIAGLHEVKTMKDGGGRIVFEFGNDSIDAIVQLQKTHSSGELLYALALVPVNQKTTKEETDEFLFEEPELEPGKRLKAGKGEKSKQR